MNLTGFLKRLDVELDLVVTNKPHLLKHLAQRASVATELDEPQILHCLQSREDLGSTGIGHGVALPHAAVAGLTEPFGVVVRLAKPLAFNSIDATPVDLVILVLLPPNGSSDLSVLSSVAGLLRSAEVRHALRSASDAKGLQDVLRSVSR